MDVLHKLILELYRAARETPVEEFQELALSLLKTQLPFRTAIWGGCEAVGNKLTNNSIHLHNEPLDILHEWASLHLHDPLVDRGLANPGTAQVSYAPGNYHDTGLIDFIHRFGHINTMVATDLGRNHRDGTMHGEWLGLYRADKHAHFGKADQRLMETLMPHLVEALAINRTLGGGAQLVQGDFGLAGTRALARADGTLYHCGKKFAALLREIWPEMKNGRLPGALMAALVPEQEAVIPGHDIAITSCGLGSMVLMSARRVSPLVKLSPRELAVARLFGQGKSHKEIALQLDIAPSTARNFLGSAYKKLNIGDKAELAALINESF